MNAKNKWNAPSATFLSTSKGALTAASPGCQKLVQNFYRLHLRTKKLGDGKKPDLVSYFLFESQGFS